MNDILLGSVDYTKTVFIPDPASTDGSGKTGLVAANLTVSYTRVETDNDVVVTDVTSSLNDLAALTTAHTDWGIKEVSNTLAPGLYRLDIADAVFASGAVSAVVYVMITTSAAAASPIEFNLVAYNKLDGVRLGLTALPNAAADAAGGLPISDAGGLDLDARLDAAITSRMATYAQPTGFLTATFPAGTVANTTNITAGTITTATNATNISAGGIVAASFAANAITAAKLDPDVTTELQAGLATAVSLTAVEGKIDTIDGIVDSILVDTAEIGAAGAGLTNINLPNQTMDIVGNITGNLSGTVGSVTGLTASNLDATISSRASQASVDTVDDLLDTEVAAIKTVVDAILVDTAEIGAAGAGLTVLATQASVNTIDDFLDTEVAAILADTNELQTDWANGGRLDIILDARASQTSVDDLPTNAELATALGTADDAVLAQVALVKAVTDKVDDTLEDDGGTFRFTANALEEAPSGGGSAPTAAEIADAVWDEDATGHQTTGTFGQAIGDPVADTNTIYGAVVTGAAGATVAVDIIAVKAETAAIVVDTNELQTDWVNGGRLDNILDARASQTSVDDLPTNAELATAFGTADDATLAALSALDGKVDTIDNFIDTEVTAIKAQTDKLTFDGDNHVAADARKLSASATAADNLELGARALVSSTCAAGSTTTSIVTNLTEATDDHYNGRVISFVTGDLAGQSTNITDYNGTTKALTVTALTEAPADTNLFVIS